MTRSGQPVTLALIAAASMIFGMVVAGGLHLTTPGRAAAGCASCSRRGFGGHLARTARPPRHRWSPQRGTLFRVQALHVLRPAQDGRDRPSS